MTLHFWVFGIIGKLLIWKKHKKDNITQQNQQKFAYIWCINRGAWMQLT